MADTIDLLGLIGTWIATLLALVALAGIIPAYILYRESQTEGYEAFSLVDDGQHEYVTKGYTLLPGKRFFRSIRFPDLKAAAKLMSSRPYPTQMVIKRDCDMFARGESHSSTAWVKFANILRAYNIYPSSHGKLKFSGTETLLPTHRTWLLLIGLVDRYCRRKDSGLFVEEPRETEWNAFGDEAICGLSGIMQRIPPFRDRVCFRMHAVTQMKKMPEYLPSDEISPKDLLFLYLGYLPASDGSLYRSEVPSDSSEDGPSAQICTGQADLYYKFKPVGINEGPVHLRRVAEEMGIDPPKIWKLTYYTSSSEQRRRRARGNTQNLNRG